MGTKRTFDLSGLVASADFSTWFSNSEVRKRLGPLKSDYVGKWERERELALEGISISLLNYSILAYYFYEMDLGFRRKVDATPELKRNYGAVRKWLDAHGGKEWADEYFTNASLSALGRGR